MQKMILIFTLLLFPTLVIANTKFHVQDLKKQESIALGLKGESLLLVFIPDTTTTTGVSGIISQWEKNLQADSTLKQGKVAFILGNKSSKERGLSLKIAKLRSEVFADSKQELNNYYQPKSKEASAFVIDNEGQHGKELSLEQAREAFKQILEKEATPSKSESGL